MTCKYIVPHPELKKYIKYFWVLEDSDDSFRQFRVMPDGLPGMIFQDAPSHYHGSSKVQLPQAFVYGQTTSFFDQISKGYFRNVGIYFQPAALKFIFGLDMKQMTNQNIDIQDIIKTSISDQILNTSTIDERIEILTSFFQLQIAKNRQNHNSKVNYITDLVQRGQPLSQIQTILNISERSLERIFEQYIGIPPKLYSRICRFQSSLNDLRNVDYDSLTEIAHKNCYSDQAHFIRDFNTFTGVSPKSFSRHANEQIVNFPEWKL